MSTKELRPALGGARIKTRKRNIAVPLDPGSFAEAVITIFENAVEDGATVKEKLEAAVKVLETTDLDFSRYGDTLFEVLFTGSRLEGGLGNREKEKEKRDQLILEAEQQEEERRIQKEEKDEAEKAEKAEKEEAENQEGEEELDTEDKEGEEKDEIKVPCYLETNILDSDGTREGVTPYFESIQQILRRRPFLIKNIENVLRHLMQQLEHLTTEQQNKIAVATSLTFSMKLGLPPENVFNVLMNDVMIGKGTILSFMTHFMQDFLSDNTLEEMMITLKRGKVEDLMLFFPMQKRTPENFEAHFKEANLPGVAEKESKRRSEVLLRTLGGTVLQQISDEESVNSVITFVKSKKTEGSLADNDIVQLLWASIVEAIQWAGKNQQQTSNAALRQVKNWAKLLKTFTVTKKLELELLNHIQVYCYEDNKLMKTFPDIVRLLYDQDVLDEATVLFWHKRGSSPKGRTEFLKTMEPFITWLEEAEEESEEEA